LAPRPSPGEAIADYRTRLPRVPETNFTELQRVHFWLAHGWLELPAP
jgi:hypothetical protein